MELVLFMLVHARAIWPSLPQRLKPSLKIRHYRSGKPLRHPKARARSNFLAKCKTHVLKGAIAARLKPRPFKALRSYFNGIYESVH